MALKCVVAPIDRSISLKCAICGFNRTWQLHDDDQPQATVRRELDLNRREVDLLVRHGRSWK
jgi:hypothetical protein